MNYVNWGAIFTYRGGEEGVMSSISVLNYSMEDQDYILLGKLVPKLEISQNTSIGGLFSTTGESARGHSATSQF